MSEIKTEPTSSGRGAALGSSRNSDPRPLVTLVLPAYNEAAVLRDNVAEIERHIAALAQRFRWEVLIINDGSRDQTAAIAEALRGEFANIRVIHHARNGGLGRAFRTAFEHCCGDYVVTLDIDLSYSPDHIEALLEVLIATHADLVLASPYMKGGRLTRVPWLRKILSISANRFLSLFSHGNLSTLTCMVRGYRGDFVRSLILRSTSMDIMPEVVYKSMILRGRIEQVPAHLDWSRQVAVGVKRRSSMRILRQVFATLLAGFILRPFMFFIVPGLVLLVFALYTNAWMIVHFVEAWNALGDVPGSKASAAVAQAYALYPHTFIVGLLSLMLSIQLVSLGILALQNKAYFEEIFHLGTALKTRIDSGMERRN